MRKILSATLAASVLAAGAAQAANPTVTTTFQVSATVQPNCTTSATALGFGNYTPGNGAVTANSTITVNCTKSTGYTIALNPGSTTGDAYTQRLMTAGAGATLQYNLYTTAALTTVFGDGTSGATATDAGTGTGMANALQYTVYGQLPDNATNQASTPGTYTDTITVTVTY
jgi:spore coat protein U-like protein